MRSGAAGGRRVGATSASAWRLAGSGSPTPTWVLPECGSLGARGSDGVTVGPPSTGARPGRGEGETGGASASSGAAAWPRRNPGE